MSPTAASLTVAPGPVLGVMLAAALALSLLRWPELPVALAAVVAMCLLGALAPAQVLAVFSHELLWLIAGAGVFGAVLQAQGLVQRLAAVALRGAPSVAVLCWRLTALVAASAWLLPSTAARAALCLPLFLALAPALQHPAQRRVLALLFPTTILLSAGGSMLGAGAHLIAVDSLRAHGLPAPTYLGWLLWTGPFAAASCAIATTVLLHAGLDRAQRRQSVDLAAWPDPLAGGPWSAVQRRLLGLLALTLSLWSLGPAWGLGPAPVAWAAALLAAWPRVGGVPARQALAGVDLRLLGVLAASLLLAQAMLHSGAAQAVAAGLAGPAAGLGPSGLLALVVTIALGLHLLIGSRSARVAVLLPVLVLPLAMAQGPAAAAAAPVLVMAAVLGTGFCQSLAVSAKPMALFAVHPASGLAPGDLLRLSLTLFPLLWLLLMGFGLWVWPALPAVVSTGYSPQEPFR